MTEAIALPLLGGLTAEQFMQEYWQQKPLLVRGALSDTEALIEPEELAGLALEEDIESRIILERSPVDWELIHGPFEADTFANLPDSHWTVLVQAVNHHVPAISRLLDHFNFLPAWRIDDIMASFAPRFGSVGPHFDSYDVFLLQTRGQRRWRVGGHCDDATPLVPNTRLRILQQLEVEQEWLLNPGDLLYLPPNLGHHGIAESDCITLSVGFRAPSAMELLNDYVHYLSSQPDHNERYADRGLKPIENAGWIDPQAIEQLHDLMRASLNNPLAIQRWAGEFLSQTKYGTVPEPPDSLYQADEITGLLAQGYRIKREETSRLLFLGDPSRPEILCVNGQTYALPPLTQAMVLYLCGHQQYDHADLSTYCQSEANRDLLTALLNDGALYFVE